jgi:hypothetical protein
MKQESDELKNKYLSEKIKVSNFNQVTGEWRGLHNEVKRPLGRPRRRWEDNIKMDLQEVGGGRGDWMELAQDRGRWRALVGTVRNFRVP